jgi:hypothetical protein
MGRSSKFAAGRYAWGMCDICGIRCRHRELKQTTVRGALTGLLSCPTCWDPDHPQNFLDQYVTTDAQAIRNARPDTGLGASREMFPPGNWINGQPPSPALQQAAMDAERAAKEKAKRVAEQEERAWIQGDQAMQIQP